MGVKGNLAFWEAESEGLEFSHSTIGALLDQQAEKLADKEALVYNYPELGIELRLNFRQYRDEVDRLAKGLISLGIEKGEHVGIWAPNLPQWIFLELACARIGAVLVTINTAYRASELEYVLRQGDVKALFMVEELRGNPYLQSLYSIAPEIKIVADPLHETISSPALPRLKYACLLGQTARPGMLLYSQVVEAGQTVSDEILGSRAAAVKPADVFLILYTSGTTGFPKGAMLTHYNVVNTMIMNIRGNDFSQERYLSPMPLFHVAGCNFIIFALLQGITMIPMIVFDPLKQLELSLKEKATLAFNVPTMLIAILNHPRFKAGEFDIPKMRLIFSGGTIVPETLVNEVKNTFGSEIIILFGQTESTGAGTGTLINDSPVLKATTVGKAYANLNIKIVNPDSGETVKCDEAGELLISGFAIMKGYYNMAAKTADTIDEEGWLHSGDLATMDAQGYIKIIGRLKDMIIRGGENVYPAEIEAFLLGHPKIADVQIIGVPDKMMGEEVAALIRLKSEQTATEDEIRQYCRGQISHYKVPKYISFVNEYPLTASGKVKKYELREHLIKELALEV